jgi:hypothetical protein
MNEEPEDINKFKEQHYSTYEYIADLIINPDGSLNTKELQKIIDNFDNDGLLNTQIRKELVNFISNDEYAELAKKLFDIQIEQVNQKASQFENENAEKLSQYKKRLENTYLGKFNTSQLPNETDEEFFYRLQSYKDQIPNADQAIDDQIENEKRILRNFLKSLLIDREVEEIMNNPDIVNDNSLLFLTGTWKAFLNYVKTNYSSIRFTDFVNLLRQYVKDRHLPDLVVKLRKDENINVEPTKSKRHIKLLRKSLQLNEEEEEEKHIPYAVAVENEKNKIVIQIPKI